MPPTSFYIGDEDPIYEGRRAFAVEWDSQGWAGPGGCASLTGIWMTSSRPGTSAKAVVLNEGWTLDPKDRKARLQNEATAYAFMQAVIHDDRKKVVSLLHYPFHSYDQAPGHQGTRTWKTPASVLENYAEIVQLEPRFVRPLVPHMLGTHDGATGFMNGSMTIYEGKITWLCAGACPHLPFADFTGER